MEGGKSATKACWASSCSYGRPIEHRDTHRIGLETDGKNSKLCIPSSSFSPIAWPVEFRDSHQCPYKRQPDFPTPTMHSCERWLPPSGREGPRNIMQKKNKAEEQTSCNIHVSVVHGTSATPRHRNLHILFLTFFPGIAPPPPLPLGTAFSSYELSSASITVLTASSKTWSTPRISLLLHSTYVAPIRSATALPCSGVTGVRPWVLRRSMHVRLLRRSDFRPTRMRGVVGQKWRTSGYH